MPSGNGKVKTAVLEERLDHVIGTLGEMRADDAKWRVHIESKIDAFAEHKHEGLDASVALLAKQQTSGDKLARTVAILGGLIAITATLVAFAK